MTHRNKPDAAWKLLKLGQTLRRNDQWRTGRGRWVPVADYNWGEKIPAEDRYLNRFRRKA